MREGAEKIDVASAQHNLTTKLPPEMKTTLTSQQNPASLETKSQNGHECICRKRDEKSNSVARYQIKTKIIAREKKNFIYIPIASQIGSCMSVLHVCTGHLWCVPAGSWGGTASQTFRHWRVTLTPSCVQTGRYAHAHTHTHADGACTLTTLIFTFMSWWFLPGPPRAAGPFSAFHTHTCICLDPCLPPFYTKLPRFHAWCPVKWMT